MMNNIFKKNTQLVTFYNEEIDDDNWGLPKENNKKIAKCLVTKPSVSVNKEFNLDTDNTIILFLKKEEYNTVSGSNFFDLNGKKYYIEHVRINIPTKYYSRISGVMKHD